MSLRTERARDLPRSVFVHEILDPSGRSLTWLEEQGVRVVRGEETWAAAHLDEDALIERGGGHVALMGASTNPITRRVIEGLPDLAFISKYGIGVDSIDMAAADEHGVLVTNTPVPENIEAVAEYTVAAMLALRKQLLFYTTERMREGGWRTPDAWGDFLWRKTVGYVGFGRIARAVARRLQGWDMTSLVYDPFIEVQEPGIRQTSLEELLAESDVITLHAVASPANRHLIDEAALRLVKPSAVIINSARGSLMDLDAVHRAMLEGRLAGVALDAYEHEPPEIDHQLFLLPNVLATPHASAWVRETFQRISDCGAENLAAALRGDVPDNAVNPQVLR
jgi:D-3-phosphoglycerate dehydrogenase